MRSPIHKHTRRTRAFLVAAALAATLLVATSWLLPHHAFAAAAEQARARRRVPAAKAIPKPLLAEAPMPFRVGEKLDYQVSWSSFSTAATVELTIPERRDLYGWQTWHFRAVAHTVSPVRTLFPIDDEFDSYTDAATLEGRLYQTYLNELGRKSDEMWAFIPEGQTPRAPGSAVIVLRGTRDPLGAFYTMRGVDWQREAEASSPVYDGHHMYVMRATREAIGDAVAVPAGKFSATRIAVQVFEQNRPLSGVHFTVWLADNSSRTPVLMRADMPFGALRIQMIASSTP